MDWTSKGGKGYKKLPPDWKDKVIKAIRDFIDGVSKHNDHPLKGNRKGYRALDIPMTGPGRGGGRVVYEIINGVFTVVEIITGHKYK